MFNNTPFSAEFLYYTRFHVTSALFCLKRISNKDFNYTEFENEYQPYHFLCDHLLFSIGQICSRYYDITNETKNVSKNQWPINKVDYPNLFNKTLRNTIEHLDEHDNEKIEHYGGVGGFNVVFPNTESEMVHEFTEKENHPYTLNLQSKELIVWRKGNKYVINISELEKELSKLNNILDEESNLWQSIRVQ